VRSTPDDIRWHGKDERIRVGSFYQELEFTTRLVRALAVEKGDREKTTATGSHLNGGRG
jgi:hypothetical protein